MKQLLSTLALVCIMAGGLAGAGIGSTDYDDIHGDTISIAEDGQRAAVPAVPAADLATEASVIPRGTEQPALDELTTPAVLCSPRPEDVTTASLLELRPSTQPNVVEAFCLTTPRLRPLSVDVLALYPVRLTLGPHAVIGALPARSRDRPARPRREREQPHPV